MLEKWYSSLFVSCYNPSDFIINYFDFDTAFLSFRSVVLVGDLNSNHTAWNFNYVERKWRTL